MRDFLIAVSDSCQEHLEIFTFFQIKTSKIPFGQLLGKKVSFFQVET